MSPLTTSPVSAVLTVQPTPVPWSARQAQMSSSTTCRAVDHQAGGRLPGRGAADPEEHVVRARSGHLPFRGRAAPAGPTVRRRRRTSCTGPASTMSPAIRFPLGDSTIQRAGAVLRGERREAEAEHDGVRTGDQDRRIGGCRPRGEHQVLAERQRDVDGCDRGGRVGDEEAASAAGRFRAALADQLVPSAGARLRHAAPCTRPWHRRVRYGALGGDPVVANVVYGSGPRDAEAGGRAPMVPANTWFQTPLLHPFRALLRTRNCCWEPLMTFRRELRVGDEPAAGVLRAGGAVVHQRGQAVDRRPAASGRPARPPRTRCWSGSHSPPATLMVRLDSDRQKLVSAMHSSGRQALVVDVDRPVDDHVPGRRRARRPRCSSRPGTAAGWLCCHMSPA